MNRAKRTQALAASFVVVTSVTAAAGVIGCGKEAKPGSSSGGGACEPPTCVMNPPPPPQTPSNAPSSTPLAAGDAGKK